MREEINQLLLEFGKEIIRFAFQKLREKKIKRKHRKC